MVSIRLGDFFSKLVKYDYKTLIFWKLKQFASYINKHTFRFNATKFTMSNHLNHILQVIIVQSHVSMSIYAYCLFTILYDPDQHPGHHHPGSPLVSHSCI